MFLGSLGGRYEEKIPVSAPRSLQAEDGAAAAGTGSSSSRLRAWP